MLNIIYNVRIVLETWIKKKYDYKIKHVRESFCFKNRHILLISTKCFRFRLGLYTWKLFCSFWIQLLFFGILLSILEVGQISGFSKLNFYIRFKVNVYRNYFIAIGSGYCSMEYFLGFRFASGQDLVFSCWMFVFGLSFSFCLSRIAEIKVGSG